MKKYEKYKESGIEWIGEIPEQWDVKSLKYVILKNNGIQIGPFGSSLKSDFIRSFGFKIYGQENVIKNNFSLGYKYLDEKKFNELSKYELLKGDVVITMMGTTGKCQIVPLLKERGLMDSHLIRIRVNSDEVSSTYLTILINDSYSIYNNIKIESKGSIMEGLNSSIIKALSLPLPPLQEQTAIAAYLDRKTSEIDELIADKKRLLELYEEEKTAIINQAVIKGLNPDAPMKDSGIEWLGEIPEHWSCIRINRFIKVKDGTHDTPKYIQKCDEAYPLITSKDFKNGDIVFENAKYISKHDHDQIILRSNTEKGDIIMSMIGGNIGNLVLVNTSRPFSIKNVCLFKTSFNQYVAKHLFYILKSSLLRIQIDMNSRGGAQGFLSLDDLRNLVYFKIPEKEIIEIVDHIENEIKHIEKQISNIKSLIELLTEYRSVLISEVVTGKIKVVE